MPTRFQKQLCSCDCWDCKHRFSPLSVVKSCGCRIWTSTRYKAKAEYANPKISLDFCMHNKDCRTRWRCPEKEAIK